MIPVWIVLALCCLIEIALDLNDLGLVGPPRGRDTLLELGAFWPGLLDNWKPNFPAQPVTMFFTYAFLHGGPLHLIMNMVTLVSLGRAVTERVGGGGFLAIYVASALGGAGVYALLTLTGAPMVGASGALFGLAGAILAWFWEDQDSLRAALASVGRVILLLVGINVILYVALSGRLAWETHLGGFLAGWIAGLALDPVKRR